MEPAVTQDAKYDYDLFVIGAGSGGVRASRMSASYGARVAIAEDYRVGGTCVIRGCVPKKLLSYAAHFHEDFEDARGFGWTVAAPQFSWATLMANKEYMDGLIDVSDRLGAWIEAAQADGSISRAFPAIAVLYTLYARACDPVLEFLQMGGQHSDAEIIDLVLGTCFDGLNAR